VQLQPVVSAVEIVVVDHTRDSVAQAIHAVQHAAYAQEAELLGAVDFPPLARTVEDVRSSAETFFAAWVGGRLVGSVSVEPDPEVDAVCVASLTVAPEFQRRGIAMALMIEVLKRYGEGPITVETGAANTPVLRLYDRLGFVEIRRWVVGPENLELVKLCRST
jgi:ribosomal protein S18 acetylase RimI-like enzyme